MQPKPQVLHLAAAVLVFNSTKISSNGLSPTFSGRCSPASVHWTASRLDRRVMSVAAERRYYFYRKIRIRLFHLHATCVGNASECTLPHRPAMAQACRLCGPIALPKLSHG